MMKRFTVLLAGLFLAAGIFMIPNPAQAWTCDYLGGDDWFCTDTDGSAWFVECPSGPASCVYNRM